MTLNYKDMNENQTTNQNDNQTNSAIPEINFELLRTMPLPNYGDESDKMTKAERGKLLIVAGSRRLPGAAILVARAALRAGCGTVRVAAPENIALAIGIAVPELMVLPLPTNSKEALAILQAQMKPCDAVVIGPGLDEGAESDALVREFLAICALPAVVDAQALIALNQSNEKSPAPRIFTPHEGEMEMLIGEKIGEERENVALSFAKARGVTLALKAVETLIASPEGKIYRNTAGSRALGTAGSGDVLAGIIGSLLAQKMDATAAAIWGVHLHAMTGEALSQDMGDDGILASDLAARLPMVLRYARKQAAPATGGRRYGLRPLG